MKKLFSHWWFRIIFFLAAALFFFMLIGALHLVTDVSSSTDLLLVLLLLSILLLSFFMEYMRKAALEYIPSEKRSFVFSIFNTSNLLGNILYGLSSGLLPMLVFLGLFFIFGTDISINNSLTLDKLLRAFVLIFTVSALEELLFRGVIYQSLIEKFGESLPTILISVLFSLAHLDISRIDVLALINVFLAGVLLSIMFLKTKSLILPISFHFFWNFFQVLLLDLPLSGNYIDSHLFIFRNYDVSRILYGGTFGVEGGLIVTIVLLVYIWIVNSKAFINKESNNRQ